MEMIEKNIFRPLPCFNNIDLDAAETGGVIDQSEIDPAWPFIEGIYELFHSIVTHEVFADPKILKHYVTP